MYTAIAAVVAVALVTLAAWDIARKRIDGLNRDALQQLRADLMQLQADADTKAKELEARVKATENALKHIANRPRGRQLTGLGGR